VIDEILKNAIVVTGQVFETMFYTPIAVQQEEDELDSSRPSVSAFYRGEIGFEGRYSGKLILTIPVELAKTMAINFMGLEEAVSDAQTMDTVNELCNMICGNIFSHLDRKTIWNLTLPQTHEVSGQAMETDHGEQTKAIRFDAEGYAVQLQIQLIPES